MECNKIFSDFALIGKDLELHRNVCIKISENGIIEGIKDCDKTQYLNPLGKDRTILIPGLINSHTHIADNIGKEIGLNKPIKDVVSGPNSLKHNLLRNLDEDYKIQSIR